MAGKIRLGLKSTKSVPGQEREQSQNAPMVLVLWAPALHALPHLVAGFFCALDE
ncbi:hypothetical protein DPMN_022049 [Dreissena polymorpha]|uniref:Uncharacterized protein n=1 Tax=Dreissena polymorpha TaxID=45954 RepID=A0A9D4SBG0_DREPO|nr:hypothetical protein DPMN_022049 [Dreissena polymorpha]